LAKSKSSGTRARVATGVPTAVLAILIVVFGGPWGLAALVTIFVLLGAGEAARLLVPKPSPWDRLFVSIGALACIPALVSGSFELLALVVLVLVPSSAFWAMAVPDGKDNLVRNVAPRWTGLWVSVLYVGLLPSSAVAVRGLENGVLWVIGLLGVTYLGDVGAYFSGRAFGKHKLAPRLSPKKTIEGVIGGYVVSVGAFTTFVLLTGIGGIALALTVGFAANTVGIIGDLAASSIKRAAGVKDSGRFLAGHGGVLDRIDSVLFSLPVGYLLLRLFFDVGVEWTAGLERLFG